MDAEWELRAVKLRGQTPRVATPSGEALTGPAAWVRVQAEFRRALHGVLISGDDDAADAAMALSPVYTAAQPDERAANEALDRFVEAVRRDLGAPRPRP